MRKLHFFPAKCQIPCINGGKCNGNNKCRCPRDFQGNHCEIEIGHQFELEMTGHCKKPCRHGVCMLDNKCKCNDGWFGRFCNQRGNSISLNDRFTVNEPYSKFVSFYLHRKSS